MLGASEVVSATFKNQIDEFPQEILAGIGEIVARWGYLQWQLAAIIREITNLPKDSGRVLTIGPELGVLCNIIKTLTHSDHWIKDDAIRADLKKLAKDVREKAEHRNDYAHGIFGLGDKPNTFVRILVTSSAHRIKPDEEVITPDSLKKLADEAHQLWVRAQDITIRWKKQPASLRKHS